MTPTIKDLVYDSWLRVAEKHGYPSEQQDFEDYINQMNNLDLLDTISAAIELQQSGG